MAKHYIKKPPFFQRKQVQETITVIQTILILGGIAIGVHELTKDENKELKEEKTIEYVAPNDVDVNSILDNIESNYNIYKDNGLLNTNGLIFKYLREKISDDNLSAQDRYTLLKNILADDETLVFELYNYILNYYSNAKEVNVDGLEIDTHNLSLITNDQELMEYISKYSQMYGIPKECIIGILANSIGENQRFENNFNMSTYWNNLTATRSVRNTVTLNDDKLNDCHHPQTREEYVRYICMVLANSLKEGSKDLETALEFYYLGVDNMKKLEASSPERSNAKEFGGKVLLYIMAYQKDDIITIEFSYPSMQGVQKFSTSYISSDFKNHLISSATAISNQIYINIPTLTNGLSY